MKTEFSGVSLLLIASFLLLNGCGDKRNIRIPNGTVTIKAEAYSNNKDIETAVIPSGVTEIGAGAFHYCENLRSVTLPDTLTTIGKDAFLGCSKLETIDLPAGVTEIGEGAFHLCKNLTSVALPASLKTIGDCAFEKCGLMAVDIPSSVTAVGHSAFSGCDSLTSVTVPDSVPGNVSGVFSYCKRLTGVTLREGLQKIGNSWFFGCTKLSALDIPGSVSSIGKDALLDTAMLSGAGEWFPQSAEGRDSLTDGAKDMRGTKDKIIDKDGLKIIPLQYREDWKGNVYTDLAGNLYCRMPESLRTLRASEADYALVLTTSQKHSSNYIGPGYDTVTSAFLYGRDGKAALLCRVSHAPKQQFGVLSPGVSKIAGREATGEEIWSGIEHMFP